jgi:glycosyltransferase involved in cell wall biosynthesis
MTRIVSVTPQPVERDSRTYKQAASLARMGHTSIVLESGASGLAPGSAPFELAVVPGSAQATGRWAVGRPEQGGGGGGGLRRALSRIAEPVAAVAASARWNLRTYRALPPADLYILHSYNQYPAVRLRARRLGVPYVYDAHDSYWEEDPGEGGPDVFRSRLTRRIFERLERSCARHAARVTTVSDGVAGLLERRFGRRPEVIRNAADPRLDTPSDADVRSAVGLGREDFLLVAAGNAKPGDTIAEAVAALQQLPERVHLALVGAGHEPFAALAAESGVGDRVHQLSPVTPTEVSGFIRTADAAPILYRAWTVNFQHALPNRFFHAVAAGLPVLYPPLAEIAALCERHGLGLPIEPLDPDSVAGAVQQLLDDPDLLARLRANVERARPELSWEHEERVLSRVVAEAEAG